MMSLKAFEFVDRAISAAIPPDIPFRLHGWAGLAFDRDRHEDFAPTGIWEALFAAHARRHPHDLIIFTSREDRTEDSAQACLGDFRAKLDSGYAHLVEFYLVSPREDWLARVDFDVTLICGEAAFINEVVERAGGLERVERMMIDDFYAGYEAAAEGLDHYVSGLLEPLRKL